MRVYLNQSCYYMATEMFSTTIQSESETSQVAVPQRYESFLFKL